MPKYLCEADYTKDGMAGLIKDGGTKRKQAVEAALKSVGGSLDAFYFSFGARDAMLILDLPDNTAAAAMSLAVSASGAVVLKTTPLLTCEQLDAATSKIPHYRAPGAPA